MTEAVEAATTPASGPESAQSPAPATLLSTPAPATPAAPAAEPAPAAPAEPAKPATPEAYQLSYPEGYQLDESVLGQATGMFKELGLTQEQAQKLVEFDAQRMAQANSPQAQEAAQAAALEAHNKQVDGWVDSLKSDNEFGGAKFEENVGIAQKAMTSYGSPELTQLLDETGLGSHPLFVKLMHKVGRDLGEGSLHRTTTEQPAERSLAERMYPNYGNN